MYVVCSRIIMGIYIVIKLYFKLLGYIGCLVFIIIYIDIINGIFFKWIRGFFEIFNWFEYSIICIRRNRRIFYFYIGVNNKFVICENNNFLGLFIVEFEIVFLVLRIDVCIYKDFEFCS